jgi:hypothetical protein
LFCLRGGNLVALKKLRWMLAPVRFIRKVLLDRGNDLLHNSAMLRRKSLASAIVVPVLVGSIGLIHLTQQDRFQSFHSVDVLQLLGSGICFGIAVSALIAILRGARDA